MAGTERINEAGFAGPSISETVNRSQKDGKKGLTNSACSFILILVTVTIIEKERNGQILKTAGMYFEKLNRAVGSSDGRYGL